MALEYVQKGVNKIIYIMTQSCDVHVCQALYNLTGIIYRPAMHADR